LASLLFLSSLLFLVFLLLLTFLLLQAAQTWLLAVAGTYAGIPTVSCFILLVGIPAELITLQVPQPVLLLPMLCYLYC
jgi:hypothetical protein